tara:strand:+ start:900 stop:2180 length:1281 start_codon:yes stop_codon:yes gene_type:complete
MNILLLGSGGREHAIAWKLSTSKKLKKLFIAPGNAGTNNLGTNINLNTKKFSSIGSFILKEKINILIVGPENIIVEGIYDYLKPKFPNLTIIAPSKKASLLEGSKRFAKEFMEKYKIPTAKYASFKKNQFKQAVNYLKSIKAPYVLKANGLAAGKGVVILQNKLEAEKELKEMLIDNKFGAASDEVLIEEFLSGIELSVFVLTNGIDYKILPTAKDYKRIGEGDTGLNTGGMGSVSPVPFANKAFMQKIENLIIKPTIEGLKKENIKYYGFIFLGLIKVNNEPKVIEYNVRLGDPETQVVLPRIKSDLVNLFSKIEDKHAFKLEKLEISAKCCSTVILSSKGYPEKYTTGQSISGLNISEAQNIIFHAGTKKENNKIITNGGRVLAVSSLGKSIKQATQNSYKRIKAIHFDGVYYRKDIGLDLIPK